MIVECSRIAPKLYQGSRPATGDAVRLSGFQVLVLSAIQYQPPPGAFPGVQVIHCPIEDTNEPTMDELRRALAASEAVVSHLRKNRRVLVTCMAGLNRSGLIVAFALHRLGCGSGKEIVRHVQESRPGALTNPAFVKAISSLPARSPKTSPSGLIFPGVS
jgi:protein-tyrosine phosphatase